ncbi:hypothetical protein ACHAPJ_012661 [Fusarium lateritium]
MYFTHHIFAATALSATLSTAAPTTRSTPEAAVTIIGNDETRHNTERTFITVPLGKLTTLADVSITTLKLSALTIDHPKNFASVPTVDDISCQMYKDKYGVTPGSTKFTRSADAHISTNPVSLGWILCYVNVEE